MTFRRAFGYFFREAASDLWKRRMVNLVSVSAIGASLYAVGLFLLIMMNVGRLVSSWAEENRISVYLSDACTESERIQLRDRIAGDPAVREFEFVGKEEALARFRKEFPDLADLTAGLDANPLPASFEITVRGDAAVPATVEGVATALQSAPGVDGVRYDLEWVQRIRTLLTILGWGGAVLGGIMLGAAMITISGVIRLNVLARREEIEILELIGATRGFIRGPFLVEGAFQGVAAALVATGLITTTWLVASSNTWVRSDLLLSMLAGGFLPLWAPPALLALGLTVGLAGSLLSLRRAFAGTAG